ncbi:GvpL/GvpF family gas vesicle protein [Saccharopolyspora hordei]|uniref:GvpL/GvpF family gas vesicle protein n=1 Tax=Saccharopolyspora hordei TaxID=1838 RepID=A0A853AQB7_9PSEU|nr:GvpL/GvpF family gas vesicle protein [Saccharopolyspora hordei]NYI84983.1 hypothetical protein [Saccharopolyspora hordei]
MMSTNAVRGDQVADEGQVDRGFYVYGILGHQEELPDGLPAVGDDDVKVELATHGNVSAVISELPLARPLGKRQDLMAHQQVLDTLAADATVIPIRFGSVLKTKEAVVDELLAPHHDRFEEMLAELAGLVQFTIRGKYAESAHIREIVAEDPEIQQLRETVRGLPEEAGYAERMRLGELVNNAVVQKREADAEEMVRALEAVAVASNRHDVAGEDDAVHVAFLVGREVTGDFEQAVEDLGQRWAGRINLRLLGPLAPYDFMPES